MVSLYSSVVFEKLDYSSLLLSGSVIIQIVLCPVNTKYKYAHKKTR